jgi:2',3'-cyclic-nucleotide 2'-phosphodiesterase / 3'-nucleotidase
MTHKALPVKDLAPAAVLPTVAFRLLATSDLHAHLLAWDYYADRASNSVGLARVAALIAVARAEVADCLYLDNGDLIEGNPLADLQADATAAPLHPMVAALNALGCDAATLGNHEFSHGMAFLRRALAGMRFPVVSANMLTRKGDCPCQDATLIPPYVILDRMVRDQTGALHPLRVGVFGLTPPQVLEWDGARIDEPLAARDMVGAARHAISCLRADGADLVVALAHTGIGAAGDVPGAENAGLMLAGLPGLDALVLGHVHQVFPSGDFRHLAGADVVQGHLHGVPAVMPGTHGSHLGVIDLTLVRHATGWRVERSRAEARPIAARDAGGRALALVADDPGVLALAAPAHQAVRDWMAQPIGQTVAPLHSFWALVDDAPMQRLIAAAQGRHLRRLVADTAFADLPILSAVAPFKTGGRSGPENFTHIPAGPLLMRHAADLYVFPNTFAALVLTGAEVEVWLERAVSAYTRLLPDTPDQPLLDPAFPGFGIEMIAGITYSVDVSAAAMHDAQGALVNPNGGRIRDLRFDGKPLDRDARFALATNSYRLGVTAALMSRPPEIIATGGQTIRQILLDQFAASSLVPEAPPSSWHLRAAPGRSFVVETGADALRYLHDVSRFRPENLGHGRAGFLRFRLHL